MKNFILVAGMLMMVSVLHAQDSLKIYIPNTGKKPASKLRYIPYYNSQISPYIKPDSLIQTMPVVGKIKQPVYAFNNGNGSDVYRSPLDQMFIAEPDSTFQSNMPVKRFGKTEGKK